MNQRKTKLMVVNGTEDDKAPINTAWSSIQSTEDYVYLGSHFTAKGSPTSVMQKQSDACRKQALKFAAFINKNPSMPFHLKEKVLEAAVISSMTYGCEGWPSQDLKAISKHHMNGVKLLLGVRRTTPNTLCLIEIGHMRQGAFLRKFLATSSGDEPLHQALRICSDNGLAGRLQRAAADPADPANRMTT